MLNKENEYNAAKELLEESKRLDYESTKQNVRMLMAREIILAKCIYDNFVDRGLIDNSDTFQQEWYDYFFNDKELDLEHAPQEYKKILDKVGNFNEKESD